MIHPSSILRAYKTASWVTPEEIIMKPGPEWASKDYQVLPLTKVTPIEDGHVFDLGTFKFQVILKYVNTQ